MGAILDKGDECDDDEWPQAKAAHFAIVAAAAAATVHFDGGSGSGIISATAEYAAHSANSADSEGGRSRRIGINSATFQTSILEHLV
jgi:hypothetical protein